MKITFITEYGSMGGGERNLFATAAELAKNHSVSVLCPLGPLADALKSQNILTFPITVKKRWLSLLPLPSWKFKHPELTDADVIHVYSINSLPLCARYRKKVVLTLHGFWEKPRLRECFIRFFAVRLTTVSNSVLQLLRTHDDRVQIVPLGQNFPDFPLKSKKFAPTEHFRILCLGRFQKIKGQDLLVAAMKKLKDPNSNPIELKFVGNPSSAEDQSFYDDVVNSVQNENWAPHAISFSPFQKDVFPLIQGMHLTVVPSLYESFSMVTIESLWAGTPVIVPNAGGAKEIVDSAKIGTIFESGNADSLAEAIQKAILDYSKFSSDECRLRANHYTIKQQCENLMAIYSSVARKLI